MRLIISLASLLVLTQAAPQSGYNYPAQQHQGGNKYLPPSGPVHAPLVHKQFYLISAPEDNGEGKVKHLVLGRPQKNYRVVFIKAPNSDNANIKYSVENAPNEEKTVIYVLTKKDKELNSEDIATPEPTQPSKPEVFFIKYKTEDEAQAAQKDIQDQYRVLGGTEEFSDEGRAPLTSVVGSLDGGSPDGGYDYKQIRGSLKSESSSQYLPPVVK